MRNFQIHVSTECLRVRIHFRLVRLSRARGAPAASPTRFTTGALIAVTIRIWPATPAPAAGGTTSGGLRLFEFVGKPLRILVILVMLIPDLFDVGLLFLKSSTLSEHNHHGQYGTAVPC